MNMEDIEDAVEMAREALIPGRVERALLALWDMLPRWTREVPKEPGLYRLRCPGEDFGGQARLFAEAETGRLRISINGGEIVEDFAPGCYVGCEWARIPEPLPMEE